jgi:hypothetical protein
MELFDKIVKTVWNNYTADRVEVDKTKCKFQNFLLLCKEITGLEELSLSDMNKRFSEIYDNIAQVNICEDFGKGHNTTTNPKWFENLKNEYFILPNGHTISAYEMIINKTDGEIITTSAIKRSIIGMSVSEMPKNYDTYLPNY